MEPLLLLHGAIGSKLQLQPLEELLQHQFNIHNINFDGHGGKPLPDEYSIQLFANNVLTYLDEHSISKTNIFGYSMGGYVALHLCKHYPDRINKVITLATKFLWNEATAQKETQLLNPGKIKEKLPAFASTLANRHHPQSWEDVLLKTSKLLIELAKNNDLSFDKLNHIKTAILIILGDRDVMVTFEETIMAYRALPNANLCIMPYTQHPIEKIDWAELGKIGSAFLSK